MAGGRPVLPMHSSFPSQSPVWQPVFQFLLAKLQPVLAHTRPVQSPGTWNFFIWPDGRQKPPLAITGWPWFAAVAGHIGKGHRLLIVNVHARATSFPAYIYAKSQR